jgi:diguanylate cyclase (GGDEF)-like protein
MEYLIQFQIHVLALAILLVLHIYVRLSKIKSFSKQIIMHIIIASAMGIILEPLTWLFDGKKFLGAFVLEYGTNFALFLMAPVIGGLMLSYVDHRIFKDRQRIFHFLYYQHVTFLTLILLMVNFFYPIYFKVDFDTNVYGTGDFIFFHYLLIASLYLYMVYFIIRNKDKLNKIESSIFICIFAIPVIAMFLQTFYTRLHLSWTFIALSILVAYIFLETSPSEEDYLTKLYNRRSFEQHVNYLIQSRTDFGMIIFDLNNFKSINDEYGHKKGDEVLIEFSKILKVSFKEKGLVARMGGDEFSVVLQDNIGHVHIYIDEISSTIKSHMDPVMRDLSFGFGFYPYEKHMTLDDLYILADKRMYDNKRKVKGKPTNKD